MKVSIIIPAHNEEKIIDKTIQSLSKTLEKSRLDYEILAVDDNSDDNTLLIMKKLAKKNKRIIPVHKISNKKGPTGIGSTIYFGFEHSNGDVIIPFMGDLSDDPRDVLKLVEKINDGYDVVCASRFVKGSSIENYPITKLIANRFWNNLFSLLFGLKINDISNAFKAYRREVVESTKPKSKGFEMTAEIALKAHVLGFKVSEVPCSWRARRKGAGASKFGSFSLSYVFTKLPKVGYVYIKVALKIWFNFIFEKISAILKT